MKDRVPLYPGRVKLVPVSGQENVYDMTRADQPTQQGDPLNKATLLKDATAALFGLSTDAVPDDVLAYVGKYAQHWWKRRTPAKEIYQASESVPSINYVAVGWQTSLNVSYSDSYSLNQNTGEISLVSPTTEILETNSQTASALNIINTKLYGKYFNTSKSSVIYKIDKQLVVGDITLETDWYVLSGRGLTLTSSKTYIPAGEWEYLQSSDRSEYPDSGEQDGYEYQYLGVPFENAASAHVKIATGSYVGTGKYGSSNKNNVYLGFYPKLFIVYNSDNYGFMGVFKCEAMSEIDQGGMFMDVTLMGVNIQDNHARFIPDSGGGIRWWSTNSSSQFNNSDWTYYYFALC